MRHHPNKAYRLLVGVAALIVLCGIGTRAHAASAETQQTTSRYDGMFVVETKDTAKYLWYVHPGEGVRYAVRDSNTFSRLLKKVGEGSSAQTLNKLAEDNNAQFSDAALRQAYEMKGKILIAAFDGGKAWYVNPLDLRRYYLANGAEGFATAQNLALDISDDRLNAIPVTTTLGFSEMRYASPEESSEATTLKTDVYDTVFNILNNEHYYHESFTPKELIYGSIKGMTEATGDIHTEFYPPAENTTQQQTIYGEATVEGIGAVVDRRNNTLYVIRPISNGPADRAGIKGGDSILAIDSVSTHDLSVDQATSRIKGPAGSTVKLTVFRPASSATFDLSIMREKVLVTWVNDEKLDNGAIGYISIGLFTSDLIDRFKESLARVTTDNMRGLIIDLRNNNGGITQSSMMLADYWLRENETIMIEKRRAYSTTYVASGGRLAPQVPTIILMNEETASASEIFIGALKHYNQATTVGTTSFGKGTGQNLINFDNGSGLKYTTFEWLLPDNTSVDKKGISPDYEVKPGATGDAQLERAIQLIRSGN